VAFKEIKRNGFIIHKSYQNYRVSINYPKNPRFGGYFIMSFHSSKIFSVGLCLVVCLLILPCAYCDLGDITQDGVIDGRDALKIMRIVDGLESSTTQDIELGDVYPYPGTEGRRIGDGQLTPEDARTILQKGIGSVSETEINTSYENSAPWIDDCFPSSGSVGDEITLIGGNFITNPLSDNSAYLGGQVAEIQHVSGNVMVVRVPDNAYSGIFSIHTPGGVAECPFEFRVTQEITGKLDLGNTMNPSDFIVTDPFESKSSDESGQVQIHVQVDGLTIVGAVPEDQSADNIFYSLIIPGDETIPDSNQPEETQFTIDSLTTAKTLVFLCPFVFTQNIANAKVIYNSLGDLTEVNEFAEIIKTKYAENTDGLDDPEVGDAYIKAIKSYMNSLPSDMTVSILDDTSTAKTLVPASSFSANYFDAPAAAHIYPQKDPGDSSSNSLQPFARNKNGLSVMEYNVDRFDVKASYDENKNQIKPYLKEQYGPLDYVTILYRIDPDDMPEGVNESRLTLRKRPLKTIDYKVGNVLQGSLWTAKIDVAYNVIDLLFSKGGEWVMKNVLPEDLVGWYEGDELPLEDLDEGVYMLRIYSGALVDNDPHPFDFESIDNISDGKGWHYFACTINVMQAAVDFWDLVTADSYRWSRTFFKKGVKNAIRRLTAETANTDWKSLSKSEILKITSKMLVDFLIAAGTTVPQKGLTVAQDHLKANASKAAQHSLVILEALDRISSAGRIAERLLGLAGRLIIPQIPNKGLHLFPDFTDPQLYLNPQQYFDDYSLFTVVPYGPTPLESILFVVGNPFDPILDSVQPDEGVRGQHIRIYGENLRPPQGTVDVEFAGEKANVIGGNEFELVVEVPNVVIPDNKTNRTVELTLETSASSDKVMKYFTVYRFPYIDSVDPTIGYARAVDQPAESPVSNFQGTEVLIKGDELYIDNQIPSRYVKFGDSYATVLQETGYSLRIQVGSLEPGETELYITDIDHETTRIPFTILGPPTVETVYPTSFKSGQFIELEGTNLLTVHTNDETRFHLDIFEKETLNPVNYTLESYTMDAASIQITHIVETETPLILKVWNPAGGSSEHELILQPGTITYSELNRVELEQGATITVDDGEYGMNKNGRISLDEACAFARGDEDPFSSKWDDLNQKWTETYEQIIEQTDTDPEGNPVYDYIWKKTKTEPETLTSGNGPHHEIREIYRIDVYHIDNGGEVTDPYLTKKEDLDDEDEAGSPEEGDLISVSITLGEITSYNGTNYHDEIRVPNDTVTDVLVDNPSIGNDDRLFVTSNVKLLLTNGFTQANSNCRFGIGDIISKGPIEIKGSGIEFRFNSIEFQSDGFLFDNSFACWLYGTSITECQGTGIYLRSGGGHILDIDEIANCQNVGVYFDDSVQNILSENFYPNIHDCAYGVVIDGGKRNKLFAYVNNNEFHGIDLADTTLNYIGGKSYSNGENGVNTEGNIEENWFQIQSYNNKNGFVFPADGNFEKNRIGGAYYRNSQYGIHLKDSVNYNNFIETQAYGNGSHGILLEGYDTGMNTFKKCFIGTTNPEEANGGDGVRITNEAVWTTFDTCHITGNTGNGISIGNDVFHTEINNCRIGHTDLLYTPDQHYPNQGWGLLAEEKPIELLITDSVFGINGLGGMRIVDPQPFDIDEAPPLSIKRTLVGYKYTGYGLSSLFPYDTVSLTGTGIALEDVRSATLDQVYIHSHDTGFSLSGTNSGSNTIDTMHIINTNQIGAEIIHSITDTITDLLCTEGSGDGLRLESTSGTQIRNCPEEFEDNGGIGISVNQCNKIVLDNISVRNSGSHGFAVESTNNLTIQRCESRNNNGDGLSITNQSNGAMIDWLASAQNQGHGYNISDSRNVVITNSMDTGRLHTNTIRCYDNEGCGLYCNNSNTVFLGVTRNTESGLSINYNNQQGIYIKGDQTDNIVIQGNSISSNTGGGIQIDAGKHITIGGLEESRGNFIGAHSEFNIWANGSDTDVQILSNRLGFRDYTMKYFQTNNGILLSNDIHDARIESNEIYNHINAGILIHEGSHDNFIQDNTIRYNGINGIFIKGALSTGNTITRNIISSNQFEGIKLEGGNNNIEPPTLRKLSGMGEKISGVVNAPLGSMIEVYADYDDEGKTFLGSTRILGNEFTINAHAPLGKQIHAIVIDPNGNTSEFGPSEIFAGNQFDSFVYAVDHDGQSDLYFRTDTATIPTRLTQTSYTESNPKYSPNGENILYVSNQQGNQDIYMMDNNGQNPTPVIHSPVDEYDPVWGSDNQSFLYVSEEDGNPEIYSHQIIEEGMTGDIAYNEHEMYKTLNIKAGDGMGLHFTTAPGVLSEIRFYVVNPAEFSWKLFGWADNAPSDLLFEGNTTPTQDGWHSIAVDRLQVPEDFVIAFFPLHDDIPELGRARYGNSSIPWRYEASNASWNQDWRYLMIEAVHEADPPQNVTQNPAMDRQPTMSPNGDKIAFSSNRSDTWDIWVMDVDGSNPISLTNGEGQNTSPVWSPDGEKIAFVSTRNGNHDIFVMDADGSNLEPITEHETSETDPVWNPSGSKVYYSADYGSGREIYSIAIGSTNPVRITHSGAPASQPNIAPLGFVLQTVQTNNLAKSQYSDSTVSAKSAQPLQDIDPIQVILPEIESQPGETVSLTLSLQDAIDVGSITMHLLYDEDALELSAISNDRFQDNSMSVFNTELLNFNTGTIHYSAIRSNGFTGEESVIDFEFQLSSLLDESDTYEVIIDQVSLYDTFYATLPYHIQDGLIHVSVDTTSIESWMIY
jgi:Tol biopolymer transport system component